MICVVWLMVVIDGEVIMLLRPHGSPDECILFESVYIDWSSKLLIYRNMDSSKFWHCIWLGKLENSFILFVPVSIFIGAFVRMFCFVVIMYLMDLVTPYWRFMLPHDTCSCAFSTFFPPRPNQISLLKSNEITKVWQSKTQTPPN